MRPLFHSEGKQTGNASRYWLGEQGDASIAPYPYNAITQVRWTLFCILLFDRNDLHFSFPRYW